MAALRSVKSLVATLAVAPAVGGFRKTRSSSKRAGDNSHASSFEADEYTIYEGNPLLRITMCQQADVEVITNFLKNGECRALQDEEPALKPEDVCVEADVICSQSAANSLQSVLKGNAGVLSADAATYYRTTSGNADYYFSVQGVGDTSDAFYTNWRDYDARVDRMNQILAASNGAAKLVTIGKSFEGRDINVIRMTGQGYVKGGPRVVITGTIHAREWVAGMASLYMAEQLAVNAGSDKSFLAGMQVDVVPISNPDGFIWSSTKDRFHRKNTRITNGCRGVDINRNFNVSFASGGSSSSPCSDTYHGTGPNSEPETVALKNLMEEAPMSLFLDVHSFSQLILTPYGWTRNNHPKATEYMALANTMAAAIKSKFGKVYKPGATAQILYVASGGSFDYADKLGALGYCYEVRPASSAAGGFAPPASEILPAAQETYAGLLAAIEYVRNKA